MKLFKSLQYNEGDSCIVDVTAWINRITYNYDRHEKAEIWLVWLPSYGMEYQVFRDNYEWSQRGLWLNLRTGEFRKVTRPVTD